MAGSSRRASAHHGKQARGTADGIARVDATFLVDGGEQCSRSANGFSWSNDEEAVAAKRVVEGREHDLLEPRLQVDEDVAATDQVEAGIRWIAGQIMASEDAHLADGFAD